MGHNITDFIITQGSFGITKRTLILIPVLNTLTRTREKRILNIFDHLSNEPVFRFNILIDLSPNNFQTLKPAYVLAKQDISLQLKRPDIPPLKSRRDPT